MLEFTRMDEILKLQKKRKIKVIEDNCEAVEQNIEVNF